jgi:hypothetical protein
MDLLERHMLETDDTLKSEFKNEINAPDLLLDAFVTGDIKKAYLASRLVKDENRKAFFDRVLRIGETLWSTTQGFQFAHSQSDSKTVLDLITRGKPKGLQQRSVARFLSDMSDLESKPLGYLRIWAMNMPPHNL